MQTKLYAYLATDFVNDPRIYGNIRRSSFIIQMVHALECFYWIINPKDRSNYEPKAVGDQRPRSTVSIRYALT